LHNITILLDDFNNTRDVVVIIIKESVKLAPIVEKMVGTRLRGFGHVERRAVAMY